MSEEEKILEGNKLIAEFMGGKWYPKTSWYNIFTMWDNCFVFENRIGFQYRHLKYHSSWDWLMPVIEYIDTISERNNGLVYCQTNATSHTFYINYNDGSVLNTNFPKYNHGRHRCEGESRIYNVFLAIVEFIKWYNQQK